MGRVFQRTFEPSHFHTVGHTGGTFGEEKNITAVKVFPAVKILNAGKASGCYEIRSEMLKALEQSANLLVT